MKAIELERTAEGLTPTLQASARAKDGTPYEVRAFEGTDGLGRRTSAVRVASPYGVVLAVGPLTEEDPRNRPTGFMPAIPSGDGTARKLPSDLTGDGHPEIVLRSDRGDIAVYTLGPRGATELPVEIAPPPSELRTVAGEIALWSRSVAAAPGGAPLLAPIYERIAMFDGARFTETVSTVRAFHSAERERRRAAPEGETPPERLVRKLELAFHAALADPDPKGRVAAMESVEEEKPPADLADEWESALDALARALSTPRMKK